MIDTEEYLKPKLREIWTNDMFREFCNYRPIAPKNILENNLLFIGINPSRSNEEVEINQIEKNWEVGFYSQNQTAGHKYFKKFEAISKEVDIQWTHFDLLFMQETKQDLINDILDKKPNGEEYIKQQLLLSKKLFELCRPKIIVVNNTLARYLMWKYMEMGFHFDEKIGTHRWGEIPVFFTSMLTGQRALDNGSYERLIWHIKQVLNPNNNKSL